MIPYRRMMYNGELAPFGAVCYSNFHLVSSSHSFNCQAFKLCFVVCHILEISPSKSLPLPSEFGLVAGTPVIPLHDPGALSLILILGESGGPCLA